MILIYVLFSAGAFGVRHVQAFPVFLGLTLAYALRVNLSVAIVAMSDNSSNPQFPVRVVYNAIIGRGLCANAFCFPAIQVG